MPTKLDKHRTRFHQKTTQLRNELVDFERKLQAVPGLDAPSRRRALNEARSEAATQMQNLKAEYDATLQDEMRGILRQMWALSEGDSSSAFAKLSYRNAVAEARAVKNADEALELLDTAELMGDSHMIRALGLVGQSKGWGGAVHQRLYQTDERLAGLMDQYDEIEAATTDTIQRLQDATMFATPTGTSEHAGGGGAPGIESVEVPAFAASQGNHEGE